MGLGTREQLRVDGNGVVSQFTLHEGQTASFAFGEVEQRDCGVLLGGNEVEAINRSRTTGSLETYTRSRSWV